MIPTIAISGGTVLLKEIHPGGLSLILYVIPSCLIVLFRFIIGRLSAAQISRIDEFASIMAKEAMVRNVINNS